MHSFSFGNNQVQTVLSTSVIIMECPRRRKQRWTTTTSLCCCAVAAAFTLLAMASITAQVLIFNHVSRSWPPPPTFPYNASSYFGGGRKEEEPTERMINGSMLKVGGRLLNCQSNEVEPRRLKTSSNGNESLKLAYAWYATNNEYLCSALVALHFLQLWRKAVGLRVDYVLITTLEDEQPAAASRRKQSLLQKWKAMGGIVRMAPPVGKQIIRDKYYRLCLVKFHVFKLFEYHRIIYMDADGFSLKSLDHLFFLDDLIFVAAPRAYWLKNEGLFKVKDHCNGGGKEVLNGPPHLWKEESHVVGFYSAISSALMVVVPGEKLYAQLEGYFGKLTWNGKRQLFDMDILNQALACKGDVLVLPKHYATLNSEYLRGEKLSRKLAKCKEIKKVYYLHFSGSGKPWQHAQNFEAYIDRHHDQMRPFIIRWLKTFALLCHI